MAHGAALRKESDDPDMASHTMHDYTKVNWDIVTKAILDYAMKLTIEPWAAQEAEVQNLRSLGLEDEQILSVVLITCLFNYVTRLADGLGMEVNPEREILVKEWLNGPAWQQEWLIKSK
jgi:uncharacterized peroxidase-related enzyme